MSADVAPVQTVGERRQRHRDLVEETRHVVLYAAERLDVAHADGDGEVARGRAQPVQAQAVVERGHGVQHVVRDQHRATDFPDALRTVEPVDARQPTETAPQETAGRQQRRLQHHAGEPSALLRGQPDARYRAQAHAVQHDVLFAVTVPHAHHLHGGLGVRVEIRLGRTAGAQPVTGIIVAQNVAAQPVRKPRFTDGFRELKDFTLSSNRSVNLLRHKVIRNRCVEEVQWLFFDFFLNSY